MTLKLLSSNIQFFEVKTTTKSSDLNKVFKILHDKGGLELIYKYSAHKYTVFRPQ